MMSQALKQSRSKNRQPALGNCQCLAWQGLSLRVPRDWNAVRVEGDERAGHVLLADLSSARLGVRWATAGGRAVDAEAAVREAMRAEVGRLAAEEATARASLSCDAIEHHLLYEDPQPPGRDVWVGYSSMSGRLIQLSYQANRRDRVLRDELLATLLDDPPGEAKHWSMLDLSCDSPAGYSLESHQLSAGDLRLTFAGPQNARLIVRQIGPATLALSRQPIERWLAAAVETSSRLYRAGEPSPCRVEIGDRPLVGLRVEQSKRRRAFLRRRLPARLTTCVLHDEPRDRLIMLQASDAGQIEPVARSVGWASAGGT